MARSRKYRDFLLEELRDHNEAIAYLNAALEASLQGDEESQYLFLHALCNVIEAQDGIFCPVAPSPTQGEIQNSDHML